MFKVISMYDSLTDDPLIQYYDETVGISGEAEVKWYLGKVRRFGGPVLDLACGTGRIALILANEGLNVDALDLSQGMQARFRNKLADEPLDIQSRIKIHRLSMSDFQLNKQFNSILCIDAFFHNLNEQAAINCMTCVAKHLAPESRFFFNVPNPNQEFLQKCIESKGKKWQTRGKYALKKPDYSVVVEEASAVDLAKQLIFTKLRFTLRDDADNLMKSSESGWTTRYMYEKQYVDLIDKCRLEIESLVGTYTNEPVASTSQLIFQLKLKRE
ncbi:MAG: class I SAM-dependent methyltransferase [Candidatus Hodarchaeota archaeon]